MDGSSTGISVFGCDAAEAARFRELAPLYGCRVRLFEEELSARTAGRAAGLRCVSVGHRTRIDRATLLALRGAGVEYLSTRSVGVNHIDGQAAAELGLSIGNVDYSPDSVADWTLMLMLMALRHAASVVRRTDAHDYRLGPRGRELRDLTVGVVGTGRIGSAVIDRLRGFGGPVLAHDCRPRAGIEHVPLEELLVRSDVVTLHAPLTPASHHLLDARRLGLLRPGAVVVNTGRGGLVDTEALVVALEAGRLGGAALDVVEGEEGVFYTDRRGTTVDHELLMRLQALPNVLISPHTAYYTEHALTDIVTNTLRTCRAFENGRTLA
ncbi:NAD(P)-dependent oxidoreductase [Spongisporangium articulatum]|uniref:NAD(P)-dependent oxidoreductase n=1 Tax=Spongisporangium articulatum TaxID=3362603 RepID=A0ABW8AL34_9ACTN